MSQNKVDSNLVSPDKDDKSSSEGESESDVLDGEGDEEDEEDLPGYSEAQLEAAKADAFEAGKQEGINEAATTIEKDILMTIQAISLNITELFGRQEQANSALLRDGIGIASTITKKLFPAMNEQNSLIEVDRLVEHTLMRLIEEPRVVIRVNSNLMTPLSDRVDGLKAGAGYEGRIIIKEDDSIPYGDCRMEWGDGSAERNVASLWQSIDQVIAGNIGTNQQEDGEGNIKQGAVEISDVLSVEAEKADTIENQQPSDSDQAMEQETAPETTNEAALETVDSEANVPQQNVDQAIEEGRVEIDEKASAESETQNEDEISISDEQSDVDGNQNSTDSAPSGLDVGESMNLTEENGIVEGVSEDGNNPASDIESVITDSAMAAEIEAEAEDQQSGDKENL